jgi:hypothetical protein
VSDKKLKTWACPLCAQVEMPYGKLTCEGPKECGNTPHITGKFFIGQEEVHGVVALGIAAISNEDEEE